MQLEPNPIPPRGAGHFRRLIIMRDETAIWHPSPNFGPRRDGLTPILLVLHYTAMTSAEKARDWLCNIDAEVSAHYVISHHGTLWQLVSEDQRAWHAGAGTWSGQDDINSRSIGIEIANTGYEPFPEPQMAVLEALMSRIMARWAIAPSGVIGHSDMAPGRKIDPGPHFDWARLERRGLAALPASLNGGFREMAVAAGYDQDTSDEALLHAVRLRLRPWARGPLCDADLQALSQRA